MQSIYWPGSPFVLLFLRNIYVPKCTIRAYRNHRNNVRANVLCEGKPSVPVCRNENFVRNEIFANSVRPMGFSRPSTSSYSADDGKLYSAIYNETSTTLRFDFPNFVILWWKSCARMWLDSKIIQHIPGRNICKNSSLQTRSYCIKYFSIFMTTVIIRPSYRANSSFCLLFKIRIAAISWLHEAFRETFFEDISRYRSVILYLPYREPSCTFHMCNMRSVTNIVEESGPPIGFRAKRDDGAKLHIVSRVRASFRIRARGARVHRSASVADVSFVRAIPYRSAETSSERSIYDSKLLRMARRISRTRGDWSLSLE